MTIFSHVREDIQSVFDRDQYCSDEGKCEKSILRGHPAYSLAFEFNTKDSVFYIARDDPKYPAMTETRWATVDIRYINLPSFLIGRITTGAGIILWLALAFGGAAFWNANLKVLKK